MKSGTDMEAMPTAMPERMRPTMSGANDLETAISTHAASHGREQMMIAALRPIVLQSGPAMRAPIMQPTLTMEPNVEASVESSPHLRAGGAPGEPRAATFFSQLLLPPSRVSTDQRDQAHGGLSPSHDLKPAS